MTTIRRALAGFLIGALVAALAAAGVIIMDADLSTDVWDSDEPDQA